MTVNYSLLSEAIEELKFAILENAAGLTKEEVNTLEGDLRGIPLMFNIYKGDL